MKKSIILAAVLCASAFASFATVYQTPSTFNKGKIWGYAGCADGVGSCMSFPIGPIDGTMFYNDEIQQLSIEIPGRSQAYQQPGTVIEFAQDTQIDPILAKNLGFGNLDVFIAKGSYVYREQAGGSETIIFNFFTR